MTKGSKLLTLSLLLDSIHLNHTRLSMKKASLFLKEVFSVLVSMVKAKTLAMKSKTSAMRTRLVVFGLLRNKNVLMGAISHKIHAIKGHLKDKEEDFADSSSGYNKENGNAIEFPGIMALEPPPEMEYFDEHDREDEDDHYPDLRHSLFDDEDEYGGCSGSVIDMVRTSKEQQGEDFKLEDEIDHVADIFIKRFHKKMRMEKLDSFKRYHEMLERSV